MGAAAILDFQKFEILTVGPLHGANMRHQPNFINPSNGCRNMAIWRFFKWRPPAILDLLGAIGTTHDYHLVVSIVVQNLVEIDAVG